MTKSATNPAPDPGADRRVSPEDHDIEELRRLILGWDRSRIDRLKERLDDPEIRTREISRILPEAIALRTAHDEQIAKAIAPTVEKAIEASIKKNRNVLVDALFPVMGPAIRKAVAAAIHAMVQAFDQTLEHSLSLRGLKWRWEALRTKRPFGEIVLLHTLLYRVEQIFLIHRESSLMLQHVVSKDVKIQDPDLVSAMLSAIRDFVRDSFQLEKEEGLDAIQVGSDRTIWIEQGPRAVLAAVIRGTPPRELRSVFREALDTVHLRGGEALEAFNGDPAAFEDVRPDLESCLQSRHKPKAEKPFPVFALLGGAAVVAAIVLCFFSVQGHRRWVRYLGRLTDEPGILVTSSGKRSGVYHLHGLRDPLAADPAGLLREAKIEPEDVDFHFEPYPSTHPQIVLRRIQSLLDPPPTVQLDLNDELLRISGSAPHAWIVKAKAALTPFPGISRLEDRDLADADADRFEILRNGIENRNFLFEFRSEEFVPGQDEALRTFIEEMKSLLSLALLLEKNVRIDIIGHADSLGTEPGNLLVSRGRARKILDLLLREGLEADRFDAFGLGSQEPLREEKTSQDRDLNRRVTVRVRVETPKSGEDRP